jgi:hypothetical protein
MALTDRTSSKTGMFLIVALIILIIIIAIAVAGAQGVFAVLRALLTISMVVLFFGCVFYVVYFLFFKKNRKDVPYENWKNYLQSAKDNGSDMMEDLVLTGDQHHSAKKFMQIMGYLRVMGFDGGEYDMFVGKRSPKNFLEEYKIIMLKPDQHSDLIGDVYVYGISLIMKYGFYFVNTTMLDFQAIDKTVANDTFRTIMYDTLGDMKSIMDRAVGLDPEIIRQRSQDKMLKIPMLQGQQGNNNNNPPPQ